MHAGGAVPEDLQYRYSPDGEIEQITSAFGSTQLPQARTIGTADAANVMIEPLGGETVGSKNGVFSESRYPNGSPYQQQHGPHGSVPYPHGHGFKQGPGLTQRGKSINNCGNEVSDKSPEAHWQIK